jgi:hypothetical protein
VLTAHVRFGSSLCENALGRRMCSIVFSIAFFRKKLSVQSTPTSTKSRWSKGDQRDRLPKVRFRLSNRHENRTSDVMEDIGRWPIARLDSTFMDERPLRARSGRSVSGAFDPQPALDD